MATKAKDVVKKSTKSSKVLDKEMGHHKEIVKQEEAKLKISTDRKSTSQLLKKSTNNPSSLAKPVKKTVVGVASQPKLVSNSIKEGKHKTSTSSKINNSASVDRPSSRVVRTQYFPSKQMISNVVKAERLKEKQNESLTKNMDSARSKVKSTNKEYDSSSESSLNLERPRTATLRKGSIVQNNIAGPDVPKIKTIVSIKPKKEDDDYSYEDDFDSYESDFEVYNSSSPSTSISEELTENEISNKKSNDLKKISNVEGDEDRKLDSGNFELPEYKHKHILDNIKESIEQENNTLNLETKSNLTSLSDEGFEDGKSIPSVPFINFLEAQKKFYKQKSIQNKLQRGQEILSLIHLDTQSFTLFELHPIPYSTFIRLYGNHNTVQVSTQTGDDNVSEEMQTDSIEMAEKWTQFPVKVSKLTSDNLVNYRVDHSGVTGIRNDADIAIENDERLMKFIRSTGKVMLTILEERHQYSLGNINTLNNVPFSNGYVPFNTNMNILKGRQIMYVSFSLNRDTFLTVHSSCSDNYDSVHSLRSVICMWNIYHPDEPIAIVSAYGEIKCCCFGENDDFVYAGFTDGTIAVWNIDKYSIILSNQEESSFGLPNYITEIDSGHLSAIVSIKPLYESSDISTNRNNILKKNTEQICSLDEDGLLIIWAILLKLDKFNEINVTLVQNSTMKMESIHTEFIALSCTDMMINNIKNSKHMLIATNYGYIIHCLPSNYKPLPRKYEPGNASRVTCITPCPFSPHYFLTGHENGIVYLYNISMQKCIKTLDNKAEDDETYQIDQVEWSYNKPFIFYFKDSRNIVHIWDLEQSDLYPIYSIPFKSKITYLKLVPASPTKDKVTKRSYMVIVTEDGSLHLHLLNSEHGPQAFDKYENDINMFYKYVNRL